MSHIATTYTSITILAEINQYSESFESCLGCIHADDTEEICKLRGCIHAFRILRECYVPKEGEEE